MTGDDDPDRGRLLICAPGGCLLAVVTVAPGRTAEDALADFWALGPLLALLPPGSHPLPVN